MESTTDTKSTIKLFDRANSQKKKKERKKKKKKKERKKKKKKRKKKKRRRKEEKEWRLETYLRNDTALTRTRINFFYTVLMENFTSEYS